MAHPSYALSTLVSSLPFHRTIGEVGTERARPLRVIKFGFSGWCSGGRVMPSMHDVEQTNGGSWQAPLQLAALNTEWTNSERGLVLAGTLAITRI